jgi:hypothetical protein
VSVDVLLSRLEKVKRLPGNGQRYMARCPAHADRTASLSIRETDDGRILLHCFGQQCSAVEIVGAVGLKIEDLFPERPGDHHTRGERRPWPAADILRAVAFEALVVAQSAAALLAGEPFGQAERDRLMLAAERLGTAARMAGGDYGRP